MTRARTEKILSFDNYGWTAEHARGLAEALPYFKSLKTLNLADNNRGDEGAKTLAASLKAPLSYVISQVINGEEGACVLMVAITNFTR